MVLPGKMRLAFGLLLLLLGTATRADEPSPDPALEQIPTIDELASAWMEADQLAQMPSLHNFHDMAVCVPDLLGVNYLPGSELYAQAGPRWTRYATLPPAQLALDDQSCDVEFCRWYPYQVVRRKVLGELEVDTLTRLVYEGRGLLYQIVLRNRSSEPIVTKLAMTCPYDETTFTPAQELVVSHRDVFHQMSMAYAFAGMAPAAEPAGNQIRLTWNLTVPPRGSRTIDFAMAPEQGSEQAADSALRLARAFTEMWNQARLRWAERWRQVFTPANPHFSGNLPILLTEDGTLREIYYRSIMTLLTLERTNLTPVRRVFVTNGERAPGQVLFRDTSLWPTLYALLDPQGMREHLERFLPCDPRRTDGFDMARDRPRGTGIAGGELALFRLARGYLGVTDDLAWLNRPLGGQTVLRRLGALAEAWRPLRRTSEDVLADYGVGVLAGVPDYAHDVPSLNAANVWMMREMAAIRERRGDAAGSARLRGDADILARAVLALYAPGQGVWCSRRPDGTRVEQRHDADFVAIGSCLGGDLSESVKGEMLEFVWRELLINNWMRAQSLEDPAAERSSGLENGPLGAYVGWPALTAATMCELGEWGRGVNFLRRTSAVLYEGTYGQVYELYGPRRFDAAAAVRIAMRGGGLRECSAGGAFAEVIVGTLFGFRPAPGQALSLFESARPRPFSGQLVHVRRGAESFSITAGPGGLTLTRENR